MEKLKEYLTHHDDSGWEVLVQEQKYDGEWHVIAQWEPWNVVCVAKSQEEADRLAKQVSMIKQYQEWSY